MKTKILIYIIIIASMLLNVEKDSDCEKYEKLEIKNAPSIKREDLPEEFSEKAFETVDEFIRKTADLNYEIALHFDYMTGEIINCAIGKLDKVEIEVNEEQMKDKFVASIHNHPKGVFSPPSGKNFRIFEREYEDYELIAGLDSFWILKAKEYAGS